MAFFQYLYDWFQDVRGGKLNPVGTRGVGASYPEPTCYAEGPGNYEAGPLAVDAFGLAMTRGPVLTDEKSWRYGFPGTSLNTSLTGTCTFTSGSDEVSGVGTAFLTEVTSDDYIRLSTGSETDWRHVIDVVSDTLLELEEVYPASGSGTGQITQLPQITGAGGSFAVASSLLTIASGTTSGSNTYVEREIDYGPIQLRVQVSLSQRIVNQQFIVGFTDDFVNPTFEAVMVFDGASNTQVKLRTRENTGASDVSTTTISLPSGFTTASQLEFIIAVTPANVFLSCMGQRIAVGSNKLPGPYSTMKFVAGFNNTGVPASSTNGVIDMAYVANADRLEVAMTFAGDTMPVRFEEEMHRVIGSLTTTATGEQTVCTYTVPAGKSLFVTGWFISQNTGITSYPVKFGKSAANPLPAVTASPGAADSAIMDAVQLNGTQRWSNDYHCPIYLAAAGETVRITVNPSGVTSTVWVGGFSFVLR